MSKRADSHKPGPVGVFVPMAELRRLMEVLKHQQSALKRLGIEDNAGAEAVHLVAAMFGRPKRLPIAGDVRA